MSTSMGGNIGGSARRPKVAFVIQRYGLEITGGSEALCRQIVERLTQWFDVEVLTTTAIDHLSWKNVLPAGESTVNGVKVRRFRVTEERNLTGFHSIYDRVFETQMSHDLERAMVHYQGPVTPGLESFIRDNKSVYDAFAFFTYLYWPTINGLPQVRDRAIFVPTVHDETSLYMHILDPLFQSTPHLFFNTEEERFLTQRRFNLPSGWGRVVGTGIDEPVPGDEVDEGWPKLRERLSSQKVLTYTGRVENGKGCDELVDFFLRYVREENRRDVTLLMLGRRTMPLPPHTQIISPGFVSEYVKYHATQATDIAVTPSALESLCLAALEAWMQRKPVLANGRSPVLAGHCVRSNGGLWYTSYQEFRETLNVLLADASLRQTLGEQGRAYVKQRYQWPVIMEAWRDELTKIVAQPRDNESKK